MKRKEIITNYVAGSKRVDETIAGLSESDLDLARAEGKWTIRQIVHHIADAEDLWKLCIKAALGNPGCTFDFSWYILDNKWAGPLDYATRPVGEAVELLRATRLNIAELLEHLPDVWEKNITLTHRDLEEERRYTVEEMIEWQVRHALLHVDQILETRQAHGI